MIEISQFTFGDYDEVMALWLETEGLTLRNADLKSLAALRSLGIEKCHLMVRRENVQARDFWRHVGWQERSDVVLMSHADSPGAN